MRAILILLRAILILMRAILILMRTIIILMRAILRVTKAILSLMNTTVRLHVFIDMFSLFYHTMFSILCGRFLSVFSLFFGLIKKNSNDSNININESNININESDT